MARVNPNNVEGLVKLARKSGYNVEIMAKLCRVSSRQLRRTCRDAFGCTAQEWLDQQRLVAAAGVLKKTRSVKESAFALGFKQISHFSRKFKVHYGVTPRRFMDIL